MTAEAASTSQTTVSPASQAALAAHLRDLRRGDARPDTVRHRRDNVLRLARWLPGELLDATPEDLWRWQDELRAARKVATVRCYTSHAKMFYRWAAANGLLEHDPSADLRTPRVPRGRGQPIPEDRLRVALACVPDTATDPIRTWLVLASYCGLRAGEIARLAVDDIGAETLEVDGKGGKPRTVPLPEVVRAMLLAHAAGRTRGPIWQHRTGRTLTPHDVTKLSGVALRRAGAGCSLHKLRHRFASSVYERSHDPMLVKELLGHESLATTQVYLRVHVDQARAVTSDLAATLTAPVVPARA